jgi:streptogramin lyase
VAEDGITCDDSNACTQGDHCQVGACVGRTTTTCTAVDQCHDVGTCNPGTGVCSTPAKPDGTSCDDGNICGMGATCLEGVCSGGQQSVVLELPTGVAQPSAITSGGDNNVWFISPESSPGAADGWLVRMDPSTHALTKFAVGRTLTDVAWGSDGNLWLGEHVSTPVGPLSALGRMTPGGAFLPDLVGFPSQYVIAGPGGTIWFADTIDTTNLVEAIPATGSVLLAGLAIPTNSTRGMTVGADGNIWIIESHGGTGPAMVARIAPPGGIKEFPVATSGDLNGITAGPDGNIWFTDAGQNEIGRITLAGAITKFPIPTPASGPDGITTGADGNLWFTERVANKIASITPAGVVSELGCALTPGAGPTSIASGADGNVWFTETAAGNLGAVQVRR